MNENLVDSGSILLPASSTSISHQVDILFYFIVILSLIFFIPIVIVLVMFSIRYVRSKLNPAAASQMTHNTVLELSWTIIPLILVMVIFYWGAQGFMAMSVAPKNALEIRLTAQKWYWQFEYKNGVRTRNEIVVPKGQPIKLLMTSNDVIHSFFVPNFRTKRDVVPNRYTTLWFTADKTGHFQVFCAEFCGDGHSQMLGTVRVLTPTAYEQWLQKEAQASNENVPLDELGEKVFETACLACHSTDGSPKTGPTWKGLYLSKQAGEGGKAAIADDNFLRESIIDPKAFVVAGYANVMPSFQGQLTDREISGVIEYIKKLK
jgi:cytochrome c oxidase subunit 2